MVELKKIPLDKIFLIAYSLSLLSLAVAAKKIVFDFAIRDGGPYSSTSIPQSAIIYGGLLISVFCFSTYWTYSSFRSKDMSNIKRSLIFGLSISIAIFSWSFYIIKFARNLGFGYLWFLISIGLSILFLIGSILLGFILSKMNKERFTGIARTILWAVGLSLLYLSLEMALLGGS